MTKTMMTTMMTTTKRTMSDLLSIPDESQFRAVRCTMTSNAQMNGKSASSGVESMNRAIMSVWKKTAVDALNVMLVLLNKGDSDRFEKYKKQAWERTQLLTPRGMIEMEEAYKDVNQHEYRLDVTKVKNGHVAVIGHGIGGKYIPIMARLAKARRWSKRWQTCLSSPDLTAIHNE